MKKTKIILIIAFIILIILAFVNSKKSFACGSDSECYESVLQYEQISINTFACFTNYYLDNKFYKIYIPCTRQDFIKLEFDAQAGQIPQNNYWYKLAYLNKILIKKGLEPLYY